MNWHVACPRVRPPDERIASVDQTNREVHKVVVGGSPGAKRERRALSGARTPPDKGYIGLTSRSFNRHNTLDPFTNLLLCSFFARYKVRVV